MKGLRSAEAWNDDAGPGGMPATLPSLGELRRTGADARPSSVLDEVLYGQFNDDQAPPAHVDVRREIVDNSLVIVTAAAGREPQILSGPTNPHGDHQRGATPSSDPGTDWPQRFTDMLERVRPADNGAKATADIVAQCADVPLGLAKLLAVMAQTVTDRLVKDGRPRDELLRSHLRHAARYADIAWCASHGELADCPSWQAERRQQSERLVLTELKRHLPPEADISGRATNADDTSVTPDLMPDPEAVTDPLACDTDPETRPGNGSGTPLVSAAASSGSARQPGEPSHPGAQSAGDGDSIDALAAQLLADGPFDDATDLHWATVPRDEPARVGEPVVSGSAATSSGSTSSGVTLSPSVVTLLSRLLADGRWPSVTQRDIASQVGRLLHRNPAPSTD